MSLQSLEELQRVAGPVSRETFGRLVEFEALFRKWNQRINLAARSTEPDLWSRHILDSAQLASLRPHAQRWLDLGSGGGFPGLIIALIEKERGGFVELVESNRKKAGFLQAAISHFALPGRVVPLRIEDAPAAVIQPQVVTARALASLDVLLDLASPWLSAGATALFHKGRDYRREIEESVHRWSFDLLQHPSLIDPEGVILEISNLRRVEP
ncbi:MAG: 16S rRNA (guanine(527)-N(7))-methyltransferase RsmG [Mesorhizobium sp.]